MIQGTTPTHKFYVPIDTTLIDGVRITYAQNNTVVLTKEKPECTIDKEYVMTKLSQEETFKFDTSIPVDIQIRILTSGGDALASRVERVPIIDVLDGEVL